MRSAELPEITFHNCFAIEMVNGCLRLANDLLVLHTSAQCECTDHGLRLVLRLQLQKLVAHHGCSTPVVLTSF